MVVAGVTVADDERGKGRLVANVLPDIDDDLAADIRGLPQRGGHRDARTLAATPPAADSAVLVMGPVGALAPAAPATTCALLLTIALWPAGQSRTCFPACPGLAATDVALLLPRGRASREETAPATAAHPGQPQ
ncbi:hypothetical protein ACFZDI_11550 [Streptomyces sp. NPDC007907]|uniref:hypothetical protein n=1 Tax=Streptomyces sp. NPDC007907 TaxID=3364789 RepID=UPI0036E278D2